jgi:cytochrome c-type protein NapB
MKRCAFIGSFLLACLVGLTSQAIADISSLRGASEIPATNASPELMKFVKDKENVARTFEEQPPVVPHESEKYTINLKENKCLECHMKQPGKDEAKSVEMSESHFINRKGEKLDKPAGARHFCTQCHVPQVDAPPLVGSDFQAAVK